MVNQGGKGSKAQNRDKLLAMLDEADAEILGKGTTSTSTSGESFAELFGSTAEKAGFNVGDVVKGTIVEVQEDYALVDINYKSEGLVPISEFRVIEGKNSINPGDEVEVLIDKIENENGMVVLSKDKADMMRAWNDISKAAENQEIITGTVISKVKGGLSVDIGVKAFLPGSQIDLRPVRNMDQYIGNKYEFKVIKFNKKRGNIVLSRRVLLEEERQSLKSKTLTGMEEGSTVAGIVKNITDYGAFIDLGGLDGLLHITDMSWGRVKHPNEVIETGQELSLKVLKYDAEKERVSLGLKQLEPDPWESVAGSFPIGKTIKGKVVSLADYGAFIEVDKGIEGLIHVNEMTWGKKVKHPSQIVKVNDEVEVQIVSVDNEARRIGLSLKALEANPWLELKSSYEPGTVIEGEVKSVTDFGIFVGIEDEIDGLVHISDLSWTKRVNHPSEAFKKGDKVQAVVLGVDIENERFSLGIKQLESDPWSVIETKYPIGSQHDVKVLRLADFGVFVELEAEIEGLIHVSELSTQRVEKPEEVVKVDETLKAEIISIDQDARKIGLSVKLVKLRDQKANVDQYIKKGTGTSKSSLGDVFGETLREAKQIKPNFDKGVVTTTPATDTTES